HVCDSGNRRARHVEPLQAKKSLLFVRNRVAQLFPNRRSEQHVRSRPIDVEVIGNALAKDCGSERPERLAKFDFQIHPCLHLSIAGIAKNRSTAESSRAKFHSAAEPADDGTSVEKRANPW